MKTTKKGFWKMLGSAAVGLLFPKAKEGALPDVSAQTVTGVGRKSALIPDNDRSIIVCDGLPSTQFDIDDWDRSWSEFKDKTLEIFNQNLAAEIQRENARVDREILYGTPGGQVPAGVLRATDAEVGPSCGWIGGKCAKEDCPFDLESELDECAYYGKLIEDVDVEEFGAPWSEIKHDWKMRQSLHVRFDSNETAFRFDGPESSFIVRWDPDAQNEKEQST